MGEEKGDFMRILVDGTCVNTLGMARIDGDAMMLTVPRTALDLYDHGVVEPLGRVEFIYRGMDEGSGGRGRASRPSR